MRNKLLTLLSVSLLGLGLSTTSIAQPTTTAPTTTLTSSQSTPLQQNLQTLINTLKQLETQALAKQNAIMGQLQPQAAQAKTDAQKQAVQKALLTDIISVKKSQAQTLSGLNLTEPRVKAVRDNMVANLNAEAQAAQIILNNPKPTPATQQAFDQQRKIAVDSHNQANSQLGTLIKEAGLKPSKATK